MSPGNTCHRSTNYLTEKYVGPTVSLRIVIGEGIPVEHSPANILQRQVARERYPQRQVAGESPEMSLGNVVNVVVNICKRYRKILNNDKSLSEIQLEHEKEDGFVVMVMKGLYDGGEGDCKKTLGGSGGESFWKRVMILELMSYASTLVLPTFLVF
nr:hypothetical protein [Tanacetum cinerariifolium]